MKKDFIYLERYVNDGSPSGFSLNTTSRETSPKDGTKSFKILEFDDNDETFIIGKKNKIFERGVNYAHPDSLNNPFFKNTGIRTSKYVVSPTASGRTMLLLNKNKPGFLKLTYENIIDRSPRFIYLRDALISLQNNYKIKRSIDDGSLPKTFAILPEESAKVTFLKNHGKHISWGTIYRDCTPYPILNKNYSYVPAFSLFSHDYKNIGSDPVIADFIKLSGENPDKYLFNMLDIIIDSFFGLILNCGFFSEMHAQNCLFEIDDNYNVTRLILRDLQDMTFDTMVKPIDNFPYMTQELENYVELLENKNFDRYQLPRTDYLHQRDVSYYYDFKLGEYLLKPLIKSVCNYYNLDKNVFYQYVKDKANDEYIKLFPHDYFPKEWYKIRKEIYDFAHKGLDYYYIKKKNPKFR
ncbi:MAG: hypothetical protein IKG40_01700 [Bacilli bacterium]|nr:hypothetical protein [Bacilli bacterium]